MDENLPIPSNISNCSIVQLSYLYNKLYNQNQNKEEKEEKEIKNSEGKEEDNNNTNFNPRQITTTKLLTKLTIIITIK